MKIQDLSFLEFLAAAKKSTYAGYGSFSTPSRPQSKDLHYQDGELLYIDTYLGGIHFSGEEAVWYKDTAIWSMNYYGRMLIPHIPDGFSDFLKSALRAVPTEHPYRGPEIYKDGAYQYLCSWKGNIEYFTGEEKIYYSNQLIYELDFHGGKIE